MRERGAAFSQTSKAAPHRSRAKTIVRELPELRQLFGPNRWSFAVILGVVALQMAMAALLGRQPFWMAIIVAWLIGAFCNHAMYVMIHEAAHRLIFRQGFANDIAAIIADSVNVIPAAISFRSHHLEHHAHQGVLDRDADLASQWEARLVGHSSLLKGCWLLLFPLFAALRPTRVRRVRSPVGMMVLNWLVVLGVDALVVWHLGPTALLYLALSFLFSVGFHPLGARWIQEHYLVAPDQETYSYYGPLNRIAFNVGYHNEHHDFPAVPWNRLPILNRRAKAHYAALVAHRSWTRLWLRFIFDPRLSLHSRMVRDERLDHNVRPPAHGPDRP
ncbi:MAG: fatty acid desaturase [Hyphomicrobiaceae bacterium]